MKTFSYDIFDTCFIRSCGRAEFVFDILAKRILGEDAAIAQIMDFALERRNAEEQARRLLIDNDREDITLNDIYEQCDFSSYTNKTNKEILCTELDIEKAILVPVYAIKKEIEKLHNSGYNIFFISDMYLPYDFVKAILINHSLYREGDKLYVSSDSKKTKRTGNLYKLIKLENDIKYSNWFHKGDNKISDKMIPSKLGIKCKIIENGYSFYEKKNIIQDYSGTAFESQNLASISRCVRLNNNDNPYFKFASDFIAPIYVPFVYYIMKDANERNICHLYFLARDAYILYKIAEVFSSLFPNIDIHYIYASRKSLYLPSLDIIDESAISDLFVNANNIDIHDVLDMLHLSDSIHERKWSNTNLKGTTLINELIKDDDFLKELKEVITEQRNLCKLYLKTQGLERPNSAIVDLTGSMKCHRAINKILLHDCFAYYFEVLEKRLLNSKNYLSLYFQDRYHFNRLRLTLVPHDIMEQYFSATDQDRTSHYIINDDGKVVPSFESDNTDKDYKRNISKINVSVCEDFASHYRYILSNCNHAFLCSTAISSYADFLIAPRLEYLRALEDIVFSDSKLKQKKLLQKRNLFDIFVNRKYIWLNGNLVYNSILPRLTSFIMRFLFIKKYNL